MPYVNTIHDLAFLEFPTQFDRKDLFQLKNWTAYSTKGATKVIAVSEFSKQRTHEAYNKPLADVVVASPAIALEKKYSPLRIGAFLRKHNLNKGKYFLYVGTLQPRKNLVRLVEAFEELCRYLAANNQADQLPKLVLAGKIGWLAKEILDRIESSPYKNQLVLPGFIDESIKTPLYEKAAATVLVGLHEGFGIPPLESLSVGTPVIVADNSSLPEVVGSAGELVDPNDTHQIAEAMKKIWQISPSKRKQLAKKAKKQADKFSWQKTAEIVLKTLEEVAKS